MAETTDDRIAALEQQVTRLSEQLAELGRSVDTARGHLTLSMRKQLRCPACGARSLLHFAHVRDHNYGNAFAPMAVELRGMVSTTPFGEFEIYVCRACGIVEWYIKGAGEIDPEQLDKKNRENIRIIDNDLPEGDGPYR